ncbi:sulfotransferase [Xanthomonas axonopodis pv. poinsettiicola]|uniref:tetratricopeptide repeat-containing sulfotransferase family protein n=1 Tax=Xanthomonas TaxID=338 RepID=UPI001E40FA28|nr:tetratricopeptide repeat-containing sulfotransferase family protein [Xanthomonas codiaei]MCC8537225.1 sulfotransferase [Xanthomonas codiaei]
MAKHSDTPHSHDARWKAAQQAESMGDWEQAEHHYSALVEEQPHHVPALLRLSRYAQRHDQYGRAHDFALRAADAVRLGSSPRHLGYVTLRLLDFSEDAELASSILSASWTHPEIIRQSPVLAQHLWLAGRFDDALRLMDQANRILGPNPLLLYTRANVLQFSGKIDESAALLRHVLTLKPDFIDAHWTAAKHPALAGDAAIEQSLRKVLEAHANNAPGSAQLGCALFHHLDARSETDAAWQALTRANASMRPHVHYRGDRLADQLQQLMDTAVADPTHAPVTTTQPAPVFVVGLPRTGTTLLDRMLGNHGWISSAGERNDFNAAVSEVSGRFFYGPGSTDEIETEWPIDARGVGQRYLERLRRAASATAFATDKHPQNLFNIPLILKALPHAKILCLSRAGMDAAFSNFKEFFHGGAYGYSYSIDTLATHVQLAQRWTAFWAHCAPDRVLEVRYEDLVTDAEATLASIFEFIGVPVLPGLSDITRNTTPVTTASSTQVRQPLHARGIGAWQRYAQQLAPLRALLHPAHS